MIFYSNVFIAQVVISRSVVYQIKLVMNVVVMLEFVIVYFIQYGCHVELDVPRTTIKYCSHDN